MAEAVKADEEQVLNPLDQFDGKAKRRASRIYPNAEEAVVRTATGKSTDARSRAQTAASEALGDESVPVAAIPASGYERSIRRNSQQAFAEKPNTQLVLDWDDTLFPTTWVREDCKLDWRYSLEEQLKPGQRLEAIKALLVKHLVRVEEFLDHAATISNILIVTLARRPWVENSMEKFMPGLVKLVERHQLKVIYAQEFANPREVQEFMQDVKKTPEEGQAFWTSVKGKAIHQELDELHKKLGASWKNVISLGDSDFERYGTVSAGEDYMKREMEGGNVRQTGLTAEGVDKDGHLKRLRVKTVKMLDKPTVLELTAELTLLKRWLPHIVRRDEGFDVEIDGTDDDAKLAELHKQVTDEDEPQLSWRELAGMND